MTNLERITQHNEELRECIELVGEGGGGNVPIEVSTPEEMDAILADASDDDLGKAYIYTGASTDTYEQGALYMITKEE